MQASTTDSVIRGISLLRRVGSIFVVGFIFMLLLGDGYNKIHARFKISELRDLSANGVSTLATVHPEYEIKMRNYKPELTFQYSFTEGGYLAGFFEQVKSREFLTLTVQIDHEEDQIH